MTVKSTYCHTENGILTTGIDWSPDYGKHFFITIYISIFADNFVENLRCGVEWIISKNCNDNPNSLFLASALIFINMLKIALCLVDCFSPWIPEESCQGKMNIICYVEMTELVFTAESVLEKQDLGTSSVKPVPSPAILTGISIKRRDM